MATMQVRVVQVWEIETDEDIADLIRLEDPEDDAAMDALLTAIGTDSANVLEVESWEVLPEEDEDGDDGEDDGEEDYGDDEGEDEDDEDDGDDDDEDEDEGGEEDIDPEIRLLAELEDE